MPNAGNRDGSQPLIAITGRRFLASSFNGPEMDWVMAGVRIDGFYTAYAEKFAAAGGTPVFITRECPVEQAVSRFDGIVIAGGIDLDPRIYGGTLTKHSTLLDPEHDQFEIALTRAALERGVPVLGTCRGHEVINVALGGTLCDHLHEDSGALHRRLVYPMDDRGHRVRIEDGSVLRDLYGESAEVNSFHHQAVDRLGEGARATAFAEDDVIEAIEVEGADAIGVQWHPEFGSEVEPVIEWLVERAREGAR